MKKIINGKLYDTDTAKEVGSFSENYRSFEYIHEQLFRKRTGEYFLYGEGGPMSKYARRVDHSTTSGSEDITPITYAEACAWAEEHMDPDDYIEHFGPVAEDDSRATLSISLSASAADSARKAAALAGVTLSAYIEQLIVDAAKN